MEVNGIANTATGMEQLKAAQAVSVAVFKKALESQSVSALALLEALPPVTSANLPSHLGQNINTVA